MENVFECQCSGVFDDVWVLYEVIFDVVFVYVDVYYNFVVLMVDMGCLVGVVLYFEVVIGVNLVNGYYWVSYIYVLYCSGQMLVVWIVVEIV